MIRMECQQYFVKKREENAMETRTILHADLNDFV